MVSIIIPLFNGAQYIRRSVQSVMAQTHNDYELLIVDDGSVDGGGDIVRTFADARIRLLTQENKGVSAARNRGIAESKGEYLAFLDADDEWDPGFLEAVVDLSVLYPQAGLFGTGYRMVFPRGQIVEVSTIEAGVSGSALLISDYFRRSMGGALLNASAVMIPRKIFEELGAFLIGEERGEDLEMWARISLHFPIAYDSRIMGSFHQTPRNKKPRFTTHPNGDPKVIMLARLLAEPRSVSPNQEMIIRAHLRSYLRQMSLWHVAYSDWSATREYLELSGATTFIPVLVSLIGRRYLWPLLRIASILNRLLQSRIVMKCTGGRRMSHGVLYKLGKAAEPDHLPIS